MFRQKKNRQKRLFVLTLLIMKKVKKILSYGLIAGFLSVMALMLWVSTIKIPDFGSFENRKVIQSTKIYDRTGEILLWDIHENIKRTVVPYDQISSQIKNATIAIEDTTFYQHHGIDYMGILRSVWVDVTSGSLKQGGSTISQQLIKNSVLTKEKLLSRKIKELVLTIKLEKNFSKERILDLYLNEIPYGGSNYGVEVASLGFFGKHASEVTIAEAAYLAAVPQAPTYYSPYGNHKEELDARKNLVLKKMRELGFITESEEKQAQEERVIFLAKGDQTLKAPHFSIYIRSYLEEKYGQDVVEQDGLKVITTLDYELQQKGEELVKTYGEKNEKDFSAGNAGLVAIDPKTGQILTMVGSRDYFNVEKEGNFNITLAHRQPGSSFKPFAYATAFKKGYLPSTVLFDLSTEFNASCYPDGTPHAGTKADNCYHPQNYDDKFRGPIQLRYALAQSINIPSIKTLYLASIKDTIATAKDMGIKSLTTPDQYGLTLVLGGGEVSPLDMTGAYSVFANAGEKNETTGILRVEDANGNILEEFKSAPKRVLDKNVALMISDVLSDYEAKKPAYGENSPLYFNDRKVAAKTGTTNDVKDAWVLGYTPNIAVGVWVGNNNNTPMVKKVAGQITAPLWNAFMTEAFKKLPIENFESPAYPEPNTLKPVLTGEWRGGQTYKIDKITGKLATESTPSELIIYKPITQVHSILYWLNKEDPLGLSPELPPNDFQFENWETPIRAWLTTQGIKEETIDDIPKVYDDVHLPENLPKITLLSPVENLLYDYSLPLSVKFSYNGKYPFKHGDFFLNDIFLGSVGRYNYEFSFLPSQTEGVLDDSVLKVVTYDEFENRAETKVSIKFSAPQ